MYTQEAARPSPPTSYSPPPQTPQPSTHPDTDEPSDSEDEEEEAPDLESEIDEQSDDEDDRQAHAFLRASSNLDQATALVVSQPTPPTILVTTVTATAV